MGVHSDKCDWQTARWRKTDRFYLEECSVNEFTGLDEFELCPQFIDLTEAIAVCEAINRNVTDGYNVNEIERWLDYRREKYAEEELEAQMAAWRLDAPRRLAHDRPMPDLEGQTPSGGQAGADGSHDGASEGHATNATHAALGSNSTTSMFTTTPTSTPTPRPPPPRLPVRLGPPGTMNFTIFDTLKHGCGGVTRVTPGWDPTTTLSKGQAGWTKWMTPEVDPILERYELRPGSGYYSNFTTSTLWKTHYEVDGVFDVSWVKFCIDDDPTVKKPSPFTESVVMMLLTLSSSVSIPCLFGAILRKSIKQEHWQEMKRLGSRKQVCNGLSLLWSSLFTLCIAASRQDKWHYNMLAMKWQAWDYANNSWAEGEDEEWDEEPEDDEAAVGRVRVPPDLTQWQARAFRWFLCPQAKKRWLYFAITTYAVYACVAHCMALFYSFFGHLDGYELQKVLEMQLFVVCVMNLVLFIVIVSDVPWYKLSTEYRKKAKALKRAAKDEQEAAQNAKAEEGAQDAPDAPDSQARKQNSQYMLTFLKFSIRIPDVLVRLLPAIPKPSPTLEGRFVSTSIVLVLASFPLFGFASWRWGEDALMLIPVELLTMALIMILIVFRNNMEFAWAMDVPTVKTHRAKHLTAHVYLYRIRFQGAIFLCLRVFPFVIAAWGASRCVMKLSDDTSFMWDEVLLPFELFLAIVMFYWIFRQFAIFAEIFVLSAWLIPFLHLLCYNVQHPPYTVEQNYMPVTYNTRYEWSFVFALAEVAVVLLALSKTPLLHMLGRMIDPVKELPKSFKRDVFINGVKSGEVLDLHGAFYDRQACKWMFKFPPSERAFQSGFAKEARILPVDEDTEGEDVELMVVDGVADGGGVGAGEEAAAVTPLERAEGGKIEQDTAGVPDGRGQQDTSSADSESDEDGEEEGGDGSDGGNAEEKPMPTPIQLPPLAKQKLDELPPLKVPAGLQGPTTALPTMGGARADKLPELAPSAGLPKRPRAPRPTSATDPVRLGAAASSMVVEL